eukprot:6198518-Pleurochrysis_carterae.AAC.2
MGTYEHPWHARSLARKTRLGCLAALKPQTRKTSQPSPPLRFPFPGVEVFLARLHDGGRGEQQQHHVEEHRVHQRIADSHRMNLRESRAAGGQARVRTQLGSEGVVR